MSWRDTLRAQSVSGQPMVGSYGGVRFICPSHSLTVGRRTQVHELPLRNTPIVDDLGRKARQFEVEVFVDGTLDSQGDYMQARDALITALEKPGPATMVHPWYGTLRVSLASPARVREESRQGGRATFTLSVIENIDLRLAPARSAFTPSLTRQAADASDTASTTDFANRWDVTGLPDFHLAALNREIDNTLAGIERTVSGTTSSVAAEIRSPYNMGAAIIGAVHRMADIVTEPLRALRLYQALWASGNDAPAIPTTTATRRQEARSAAALHAIVQRATVIAAARQSAQVVYADQAQALAIQTDLVDALDTQMLATDPVTAAPIDDGVYQALTTLRAAVAEDLRTRGARLPELAGYTPRATMPALVIAHRLYGDAARADEIVTRNHVSHPGFVTGGEALEVLSV